MAKQTRLLLDGNPWTNKELLVFKNNLINFD